VQNLLVVEAIARAIQTKQTVKLSDA